MKKLICFSLLIALVLSFCGCKKEAASTATTPTESVTEQVQDSPILDEFEKPDYSHINEFEPNGDGVYQIHTKEGFLNIQNHPDGKFELLWNIDLEGAQWAPLGTESKPFTGTISGSYYTVSNLVITENSADGDMGFFGVFSGMVRDLTLDGVKMTTNENTKRAGIWCGYNKGGTILRNDLANCAIQADKLAEGAMIGGSVGLNDGEVRNGTFNSELRVNAAGSATIGGMVGVTTTGIEHLRNEESLVVTGCDNKTIGLLVGSLEGDATLTSCAFIGPENSKDGKLFTDLIGAGDMEKVTECLTRDNTPIVVEPAILEKREAIVADMYAQGTIEWTVSEPLVFGCYCELVNCYGSFYPGTTVRGILYNHKACSLERMQYALDENNVFRPEIGRLGEFDGMDSYMGNDCSTSIASAYRRVIADVDFNYTKNMLNGVSKSIVPLGYWPDATELGYEPTYNDVYVNTAGEQAMFESYALARPADMVLTYDQSGGHVRLVAENPIIVRDQNGLIDGNESYLITHEQGAPRTFEPYYSSWRLSYKYSFASLYTTWYVPLTCVNFATGQFDTPMAELRNGVEGKFGMTTGSVYSNFFLDSVNLVITDDAGNTVFDHVQFTTVSHYRDDGARQDLWIRRDMHEYDLGHLAVPLQNVVFQNGKTYNYTITAHVGSGDDFVVKEGSFTQGSAQ